MQFAVRGPVPVPGNRALVGAAGNRVTFLLQGGGVRPGAAFDPSLQQIPGGDDFRLAETAMCRRRLGDNSDAELLRRQQGLQRRLIFHRHNAVPRRMYGNDTGVSDFAAGIVVCGEGAARRGQADAAADAPVEPVVAVVRGDIVKRIQAIELAGFLDQPRQQECAVKQSHR